MENLETIKDKRDAIELAVNMFKFMYDELITSLLNRQKILESQMWGMVTKDIRFGNGSSDPRYYEGAKDAFKEIARRITKEYNLILANTLQSQEATDSFDDLRRFFITEKNNQADNLIKAERLIGTPNFNKALRLQGKVASLIENAYFQAFALGLKYCELLSEKEKGNISDDEIRRTLINLYIPHLKNYFSIGSEENGNFHNLWSEEDWSLIKSGNF